jgi:predicted transcriptional regulator
MKKTFKKILEKENITPVEFSDYIGLNYNSFRTLLSNTKTPRWIKAFVFGYNLKNIKEIDVIDPIHNCQKCGLEIHGSIGLFCNKKNCMI